MSEITSRASPTVAHRSSASSSSAAPSSACAACKYQRRKCTPDCTLAPYFPADKQQQFLNVHRLFGVSNILKILKSVDQSHRQDAMNSIIYQSNVRAEDPAGGCYRLILQLQRKIDATCNELQSVLGQITFFRAQLDAAANIQPNLLLANPAAAADVDAVYGHEQQQQHYYNNYYFNYDLQQDLRDSHEHSNNDQNVAGGFDSNNYMINIGNEELPEQMLLSLQQKAEGEEEVDGRPLVDMSEMRNAFRISEGNEFAEKNISNCSTVTALSRLEN